MRRLLALAALVAGTCSLTAVAGVRADQQPGGIEGCIATTPGTNAPSLYTGHCSFTATRPGGFVASAQSWTVVVYDNDTPLKQEIARFTGSGPGCNTAAYVPGNLVDVTVGNGIVAAGNPVPSAFDPYTPASGDVCG